MHLLSEKGEMVVCSLFRSNGERLKHYSIQIDAMHQVLITYIYFDIKFITNTYFVTCILVYVLCDHANHMKYQNSVTVCFG